MAKKNKTTETNANVDDFLRTIDQEEKRTDSYQLIKLMQALTGHPPKLWGPNIIGFGSYHYRYESGHEGDAPVIAFSPRKPAISLYVFPCRDENPELLSGLGKYKMAKYCIYIKKLSDIHEDALIKLMKASIAYVRKKYAVQH